MIVACLDLEGVLVPEFWIAVAEHTGIDALRATTRDVPNYEDLMRQRLRLLRENDLTLSDIQSVISKLEPLPLASEFLAWLRQRFQVAILSDTYYEFAMPLMRQLGYPLLMCHRLSTDTRGVIVDYHLRQKESKSAAVAAFHDLQYRVIAVGDSYNDMAMLAESDAGILYRPPESVVSEFPGFPVARDYSELREAMSAARVDLKSG